MEINLETIQKINETFLIQKCNQQHSVCKSLCALINILPEEYLTMDMFNKTFTFLQNLKPSSNYYDYKNTCCLNFSGMLSVLEKFIQKLRPSIQITQILLYTYPFQIEPYKMIIKQYPDIIEQILNNLQNYSPKYTHSTEEQQFSQLLKLLFDNLKEINEKHYNLITTFYRQQYGKRISYNGLIYFSNDTYEYCFQKLINSKVIPPLSSLQNLISPLNANQIIQKFMELGTQVNQETLYLCFQHLNHELADYLIENGLKIDNECFNNIFQLMSQKQYFVKNQFQLIKSSIIVLSKHGYKISYDNLLLTLKYQIDFDFIDLSHIKFDEKFLKECVKYKFQPKYLKNIKIEKTSKLLEEACLIPGNITVIKQLIKEGIKPTQLCIQNACMCYPNIATIKYLLTLNLHIDYFCVLNCSIFSKQQLYFVFEQYKNNSPEYLDFKKIKECYDNNKNKLMNFIDNFNTKQEDDIKDIKDNVLDNFETVDYTEQDKKEEKGYKIIIIKQNDMKITPRTKYDIQKSLLNLLSLDDQKYTFIELRKQFIEYITKNNLKDTENKMFIKVNEQINKYLGYELNSYFNFQDIDNIIKNFI